MCIPEKRMHFEVGQTKLPLLLPIHAALNNLLCLPNPLFPHLKNKEKDSMCGYLNDEVV